MVVNQDPYMNFNFVYLVWDGVGEDFVFAYLKDDFSVTAKLVNVYNRAVKLMLVQVPHLAQYDVRWAWSVK